MLNRVPIMVSAPLLVGVPVLVVGVLLSVMWNMQSRQAVHELADANVEQIRELASTKVADVLSIPVRLCEVNEHLVRTGRLDLDDLESWRETLTEQAFAFDMLSVVAWGGADGRSVWISRYADGLYYWAIRDTVDDSTMREWVLGESGAIADEPSSTFAFDPRVRPWYTTPTEAGEPTWSEPFVWVGAVGSDEVTLGLSYGIPMYDGAGTLLGVVDADYSLNDLSSFLGSVAIGKTGFAVLVSGDGRLIAASNDTPIVDDELVRIEASVSPDPLVSGAAVLLGEGSTGRAEITLGGEVHQVRSAPIGREVGLEWTLLTIVPERDFTGGIEAGFRRSTITSVVAVVVAVGVGVFAARWLVSPLVSLVTAVRRIGQGDLETKVSLSHAPEYTKLGDEINEMTLGLQDRMRMRESLSLAMEVQRNLLPSDDPQIEGLDIAGHSTYCDETGGDYYDFLDVTGVEDDTAVIALGDVMGHGVAAAMLMATARGILRSRCAIAGSLGEFLEHLNGMLVPDTRGVRFMTMLLVTMCPAWRELRWASAGHGPPIIYDGNTDTFPEYEGGGIPLGIMEEEDYEEHTIEGIGSGHIVIVATDGLWETKGAGDELYGMDRLYALIRKHADRPAAEISEAIRDSLARYRGELAQDDDLTFVIIKVL